MYFSSLRCSLPLHRWKFVQNSVEKYFGETLKLSFFLSFFFAITGSISKPSKVCIHKTELPKIIFRTKCIISEEESFERLTLNILRTRCPSINHFLKMNLYTMIIRFYLKFLGSSHHSPNALIYRVIIQQHQKRLNVSMKCQTMSSVLVNSNYRKILEMLNHEKLSASIK